MSKVALSAADKSFDPKNPAKASVERTEAQTKAGFGIAKQDKGIFYPTVDENWYISKSNSEVLDVIQDLSKDDNQNVLLVGPQGCGKTELGVYFGAKYNRCVYIANCPLIREAKDWFGYKTAPKGEVQWQKSDFVRAITTPGAVVILDELNRLHSTVSNSLMPLLDRRRSTYLDEIGETLNVAPGVVIFATANIGHAFTGTFTIDAAHADRFGLRLECDFLTEEHEVKVLMNKTGILEEDARKLAKLASDIRKKVDSGTSGVSTAISTRQLLAAAVLCKQYRIKRLPIKNALHYTIFPAYPMEGGSDSERAQVVAAAKGIFG